MHERGAWWRVVVDAKYDNLWGGWCSIETLELRWGYERISKEDRCYFLGIQNLSWETTPRLDSGMMCGVWRRSLRKFL